MAEDRHVDVLIAGAGPTGIFTGLFLARYGIKDIAIIEKRPIPVQIGHASGIQPRTQEILHTLGLFHEFENGSGGFRDAAFWTASTEDAPLKRSRAGRDINNETLPMHKRMVIQHQGRTETIISAELEKRGVRVSRPFDLVHYEYTDGQKYPIVAYVKDLERGQVDRWHCQYLIAADGANSRLRTLSGIESPVRETEDTWIVVDAAVETDFPDTRRRCPIRTVRGNLMFIPSPYNTLRIYMLVANDEDKEDLDDSKLERPLFSTEPKNNETSMVDIIQRRLPNILKPYTMNIKHVRWISRYVIAQRVIEHFTDQKRLIFVGDSCHSHSPKAGQGMNTGIQDAYNLAWKLALVLRNRAEPALLETYSTERNHIAHQLIDFDKKFATLFSDQSSIESDEFFNLWKEAQGFTSGLEHQYPSNPAVHNADGSQINASAVEPLVPGKRLLPMSLQRHIDGVGLSSLDTMPANGEFYEVIFAGNIAQEPRRSEFKKLYTALTSSSSALTAYNGLPPPNSKQENSDHAASDSKESNNSWPFTDIHLNSDHPSDGNKLLNLHVIHTADHFELDLQPEFQLWKYNFFEDTDGVEHQRHGVDPKGPIQVAIVRPDGIIGLVRTADEKLFGEVHGYMERCSLRKV